MIKHFLLLFIILFAFTSCRKEDTADGDYLSFVGAWKTKQRVEIFSVADKRTNIFTSEYNLDLRDNGLGLKYYAGNPRPDTLYWYYIPAPEQSLYVNSRIAFGKYISWLPSHFKIVERTPEKISWEEKKILYSGDTVTYNRQEIWEMTK